MVLKSFSFPSRHGYTVFKRGRHPMPADDGSDKDSTSLDYSYSEPGAMPGTLDIEDDAPPPIIDLIDYSDTLALRQVMQTPEDCAHYLDTESISWVDVRGLGSEDILQRLGQVFNLHPLVLEDVVNVPQRPKYEEYTGQVLFIARMVTPVESGQGFYSEQVSFILGKHYLLTVQEEPEYDCFGPVRERIRQGKGNMRKKHADYLAYCLIDAIIDGFFPVLEAYGEALEELEDEVVAKPDRYTLEKIHSLKRELLTLRRTIWPQRDAINTLIRDSSDLISDEVRVYLRDCYDHAVQVLDMVETYREVASSLMDVYLSSVSNRMNEVMKFLTVVSSIFIPLTFIAGVYGMNFNPDSSPLNMPELEWFWGYPLCLLVMGSIALGLILYFRKQGWFENFSGVE
ncbi:magnesium/cobalt transporter CorA [Leptolyngbya sp. AN02str]|uniref:magnesium/cobalt transporter CorA n=1 Tax=Leptolyngbya sp. AN02str TaxID=3423363 RepID=UPI003D31B9E6